jgi:hypothetical protein
VDGHPGVILLFDISWLGRKSSACVLFLSCALFETLLLLLPIPAGGDDSSQLPPPAAFINKNSKISSYYIFPSSPPDSCPLLTLPSISSFFPAAIVVSTGVHQNKLHFIHKI